MSNKLNNKCKFKLYWTTTIWPKWQIVIPKEIREKLWINPWDNVIVLLKNDKFIWIVRNDDMSELMNLIKQFENQK